MLKSYMLLYFSTDHNRPFSFLVTVLTNGEPMTFSIKYHHSIMLHPFRHLCEVLS